MLPMSAITEEVRLPKFVQEEWTTIVGKIVGDATGGWRSILYTNYAIINRGEAFNQLLTAPLDDGLTRTWALVSINYFRDLPFSDVQLRFSFGLLHDQIMALEVQSVQQRIHRVLLIHHLLELVMHALCLLRNHV